MNELAATAASVNVDSTPPASAGALLRAARQAQGLHIGALAVALKVSVKKIEALEADRFQELPDIVFVRALAMSICRALKMDAAPVLALLPALSEKIFRPLDGGLNTQFRDVTLAVQGNWRTQLRSPIGLGALALLLATALVLFWRAPDNTDPVKETETKTVAATAVVTEVAAVPPAPTASSTPLDVTAQAVTPLEPVPLQLKAHGVSWVEVNDADGVTRLRKLTAAGELLEVTGKLPLSVVLGRADQLEVLVRGQPFDLSASLRANVARFEVQ